MLTTTVTIFLIKKPLSFDGHGDIIMFDPQADVVFHRNSRALTWRRFGQGSPTSHDFEPVWDLRTDQDPEDQVGEIISGLARSYPMLDEIDLIEAVVNLVGMITSAWAKYPDTWEYRHSGEYYQSVHDVQFGKATVG